MESTAPDTVSFAAFTISPNLLLMPLINPSIMFLPASRQFLFPFVLNTDKQVLMMLSIAVLVSPPADTTPLVNSEIKEEPDDPNWGR